MTRWPQDLAAAALASPSATAHWSGAQWTLLVQQGRSAGLLARIAGQLQAALPQRVTPWPDGVTGHFDAALRVCRAQHAEIRREAAFIARALSGLGAPVVLLKGAAYVLAGLPAAAGRVFGDTDILVPKLALPEAEGMLMRAGWMVTPHSEYDDRYYRQWMQELPPMQHLHRGTVLDLHHAILPETARLRPDPGKLVERARALPDHPGLYVLAPHDMVLHSMTHLFLNDDTTYALRDLSDLDLLLRHFATDSSFWTGLAQRARDLDLTRPLYYGLRHTAGVLGTPVPPAALEEAEAFAPHQAIGGLMDAIWTRALRSLHPSAAPPLGSAAQFALYLRGHWLRMPPIMLARHLSIKAWQRLELRAADKKPST